MRKFSAPGASVLTIAVFAACALQGCSPDQSSLQRMAQARLGAPTTSGSTATLPDDPAASRGRTYQAAGSQAPSAAKVTTTEELGIPVYPNAKRISTGSELPTVSGVQTISLTTADDPDAVLKFYEKFYPKPVGKRVLPGSPTWTTTDDVNGVNTRISVPDSTAEGSVHIVEVARMRTETLITLMHVDGTPPTAGGSAPPTSTNPPTSATGAFGATSSGASGLTAGSRLSTMPGMSGGSSGGMGTPSTSGGMLSSPAGSSHPTLPGLAHSPLGGLPSPSSGGFSSPPAGSGFSSPSGSGALSGRTTGSGPDLRPHL